MADKMAERVLCFPRKTLDALGYFEGLSTKIGQYFPTVVRSPHAIYLPRAQAENDPSYKQVIPYVLMAHDGTLFSYRRGKRGSEERLHELYSIGVGGHIQPRDHGLFSEDPVGYADAMWREVCEEVQIHAAWKEACVGVINLDVTSVDQVHFGIVHLVRLAEPRVTKNESPITDSGFTPIADAVRRRSRYENWSRLCLEGIDALMAKAEALFLSTNAKFAK